MIILDGKKLSEKIFKELKLKVKKLLSKPLLAVVLVGDDLPSKLYIKQKEKACEKIGVKFRLFQFPLKIDLQMLKRQIKEIAQDSDNTGMIIQLPLPREIDAQEILNIVPLEKDVDVLSEKSLGNFYTGDFSVLPPVVGAISRFLKEYKIKHAGKSVAVIGTGRLVGKPSAIWFFQNQNNVTIINKITKNTAEIMKKADILVAGTGVSHIIKGNMVKKGAIVIDVGTSFRKGKLTGDVDFEAASKKAGFITPVPGGIGPVTVACLLENLIKLSK